MTPLRRLLARHLLGIQLPVLIVLLGLVWWGSRTLLLDLAQRDGDVRLRIAVLALEQRLLAVEQAGRLVATYWRQGRLPLNDPAATAAQLMPWLHNQDEIQLLNLLDAQGHSLLFVWTGGHWRAREMQVGEAGRFLLRWHLPGPAGLVGRPPEFRDALRYDPRNRGWYQEAKKLEAPRWSTPYRMDPPESRLVLTWLVPIKGPDGSWEGALGLDLLPEDFQKFLDPLRPTPGSRIWVLDQDQVVLASAHGKNGEAQVPPAGGRTLLGDTVYHVLRSGIPARAGSQWQMVLAIPEGDLLAAAKARLLGLTALAAGLLLLPILWGLQIGRRLSKSVQVLVHAADKLGAGVAPEFPQQDIAEFHSLGQALQRAHAELQEKSQIQQQLQHSQRLETLGTLAGGIAHDVNNHLSAIMGQLFLARESLPEGHAASLRLALAEDTALSCARTTKSLLAFSRQGVPDLTTLDVNELVSATATLLDRVLGGLVRVNLDLEPGPLRIQGDRLQLEQVLMNIAVNSRDAMPEGGTLTFRTRQGHDGSVGLAIQDTGAGIPKELLPHVFEPFFTTKPVGQGTGLGLSMVFGILQAHGGRIDVESEPGVGTTFTLVFPGEIQATRMPVPDSPPERPKERLAGLRVLVAEDEAYLLETLVQALTATGAQVAGAAAGETAWQLFQQQSFDCVLSDQRMPGCTGRELLRRIRNSGSEVPFILASGQDLEAFRTELLEDPGVRLLPKPFSIAALLEVVGEFSRR